MAVAYVSYAGCLALVPSLESRVGAPRWRSISKQLITTFDFGATDPRALRYFAAIPEMSIRIANLITADAPGSTGTSNYHPKLYVFDKSERRDFLAGSANLTARALAVNTEIAFTVRDAAAGDIDPIWDELWAHAAPLTTELLDKYEASRHPGPTYQPDEPMPAPALPAPNTLQPFGDAVASGSFDPSAALAFWVEAGSMSSGGSHNQLELPRAANRFFGQQFDNYASTAVERIADLELTASGRHWLARPLTWHGDNRMERINLPTVAQGGFAYPSTAVLFRRVANTFELEVADWDSTTAIAWRAASAATGHLFRAGGAASPRICGLIFGV